MKTVIAILSIVILAACASQPPLQCVCPEEAAYVMLQGRQSGNVVMTRIEPGYFDDPDNFWTQEEIDKIQAEMLKEAKKKGGM